MDAGTLRGQMTSFEVSLWSIEEAFGYAFVGVDAAVAEEGPVLAGYFD